MRRSTFILFLITVLSLPTCQDNQGTAEYQSALNKIIKVGISVPLVGPEASYGKDVLEGAQFAVAKINANNGILGRKIQLIIKDNQSKAGENSIIMRELINREHVSAIIGDGTTGRSMEAAPIAQKNRIPLILACSTNSKVTKMGNFIFRMCFIDSYQGQVMAKFAYSLGIRKAAIILDNAKDYSIGLAQSFSKSFIEEGGQIVAQQSYSGNDKDFMAQLTAVKAAQPEAIYLPAYYTDASPLISQARQIGLNIPFLGGDGFDSSEFLKMGGQAVDGSYFSTHFSPENHDPVVQEFVKDYEKKYGILSSTFTALGYDSVMLLADAINRAGTVDPIKVRDVLAVTKNFPAVTGLLTFDEDRNLKKAAVIMKVQGGKFNYLKSMGL